MANWYFNTSTGNDTTGDGSSGTPYATAQKCWDEASSGDSIYGCGTDTDGLDLTSAKRLDWYGCDSDWTVGGAQLVFDGENSLSSLIRPGAGAAAMRSRFSNITWKRATGDCFATGYNYVYKFCFFKQCIWENNGGDIFADDNIDTADYMTFYRCIVRNNSGAFLRGERGPLFLFCVLDGNTDVIMSDPDYVPPRAFLIGNVFHDNGYCFHSMWGAGGPRLVMNNVFDANDDYLRCDGNINGGNTCTQLIIGNRFTDHTLAIGVTNAGDAVQLACNYFHGNTTDITAGRYRELESNLFNQATDGYEDQASEDYNLADDTDYRSVAISLNWDS
jgi:hypothetical protein